MVDNDFDLKVIDMPNKRKIKKKYDIPTTGPKAERLKEKYDAIYREGRTAVFELDNAGRFKRVE